MCLCMCVCVCVFVCVCVCVCVCGVSVTFGSSYSLFKAERPPSTMAGYFLYWELEKMVTRNIKHVKVEIVRDGPEVLVEAPVWKSTGVIKVCSTALRTHGRPELKWTETELKEEEDLYKDRNLPSNPGHHWYKLHARSNFWLEFEDGVPKRE